MTAPQTDANDILMGGGGAATAKFDTPGTTVGGRIVSPPKAFQEREFNRTTKRSDGPPKVFPSGDPIMGISVDVQTTIRTDAEDDGVRRIYIQGKRLKDATREAIRAAGAPGLEVGGELHVTYTRDGEAAGPGVSPPKEYTARYIPASAGAANAALGTPWEDAPPAPAASATPGIDPAAAAAIANLTPEQRAALGLPAA